MSGKFQKKQKKQKSRLPLVLGIVILLLLAALAALMILRPAGESPLSGESVAPDVSGTQAAAVIQDAPAEIQQAEPLRTSLDNDLEILDVGSYTGAYVEDGSDEILSGILMLKVINNGEKTVEYAKFTMDVNGETAEFTLSTLKPGAAVVLLEKNRMAYNPDAAYGSIACENLALFEEELNLHSDKISIQILDGAINVTNISQEDITGRIAIYYKNTAAGVYYGGITYRVTLDSGLKAGEIRQMMADHFSDTGSKIMFVTIAQ